MIWPSVTSEEWSLGTLSDERKMSLEAFSDFDEIAVTFAATAIVIDIIAKRFESAPCVHSSRARQIVFQVETDQTIGDALFNSRFGLRAAYYQQPRYGILATIHLLDLIAAKLLAAYEERPPVFPRDVAEMAIKDVQQALVALSAKLWPIETTSDSRSALTYRDVEHIEVERWRRFGEEPDAADLWMWSPPARIFEVKTALLDVDGSEYVPASKVARALEIHRRGFT